MVPRRVLAWACIILVCLAGVALCGQKARRPRRSAELKRVHVPGMKLLSKGQGAKAVAEFERLVQAKPNDDEALFGLAAGLALEGKLDAAVATAGKAIAAGLPPGRFYAGPRHVLKPLVEAAGFQKLMADPGVALVHGPMVGCVTDTSASFWVRTAAESVVQVSVARAGLLEEPHNSPKVRTTKDTDFTAVVEVTRLSADTVYTYGVVVDGKSALAGDPPRFRTFPTPGQKAAFTIGFGGGAGWVPPNERVWDTILKHEPLAFLLLGDNVYIDTPTMPDIQRYCYYRRQSRPEYRRLVARTAVYAIWDDHDFGTNDCIPGPDVQKPDWKLPVYHIFRENWVNPAYGGGTDAQPGCWFDFVIGDVHVIMTDGRYYREHPKQTERPSMLGPAQKKWLLDRLGASKATFKVLCSGVPWAYGTKPGSLDTWEGFRDEREEIMAFIEKHRIGGVILLSADRHRSDVWKLDRQVGYPLYEFESSRLTNQHRHGSIKNPKCLFSHNATQSFGLLSFDTVKPDPQVTCHIITIDNEEVHAFTLKKSQLTPK